ncbi:DoxX-like family protein [Paenibacillus sp. R14(2021)]|uniref:DoxX-like family protein n=1 Tax=Paenibacillus sp. R14(2021) TaxID=2859228 RepID=UPI001C6130B3|nr:DoxX-like family protein [Paenibacillus sp. R14(2021)]
MSRSKTAIYVETTIQADMDTIWEHTQNPALHKQWDLRFTDITYLPKAKEDGQQLFTYSTRIGFGLQIRGTGESRSVISPKRSVRLSTLAFGTEQPLSLLSHGAGYWKYVGEGSAGSDSQSVTFISQYDYQTRFGLLGKWTDYLLFRPLFGFATAWSFDLLRIWLERGIPPRLNIQRAWIHYLSMLVLAVLWTLQGLLPKLLYPQSGELAIVETVGWFNGFDPLTVIRANGIAEIIVGAAILFFHRSKVMYKLQSVLLIAMAVLAAVNQPALLVSPYNPIALAAGMLALAAAAVWTIDDLPRASRCKRSPNSTAHKEGKTNEIDL